MKKLTFTAIAALAAMLLALAPTAMARADDDRVSKQGSCSASSTWKLKVKSDDGQLETEFEVDQNRVGKRWRVTIKRNGNVAFRGIRTTRAPSGSFSVERRLANSPGSDRIVASAKALQSGETCRAVINF